MKYTIFYTLSTAIYLQGIVFKTQHYQGGKVMLALGLLLSISYIIIGLREIYKSKNLTESQKTIWTIGFILISPLTGLFYLLKRHTILLS
jgi:hypothetical protein